MEEKQIVITGSDVNHMRNVLRMKPGEEISVSDESGREYTCTLKELGTEQITAQILYVQESGLELPARISLYQGLPKAIRWNGLSRKPWSWAWRRLFPWPQKGLW